MKGNLWRFGGVFHVDHCSLKYIVTSQLRLSTQRNCQNKINGIRPNVFLCQSKMWVPSCSNCTFKMNTSSHSFFWLVIVIVIIWDGDRVIEVNKIMQE